MCVCVQYKTEKDGIQETRVEHKVVLASTDDDFDYDAVSMGINMVHADQKLCKPWTANIPVMHSGSLTPIYQCSPLNPHMVLTFASAAP